MNVIRNNPLSNLPREPLGRAVRFERDGKEFNGRVVMTSSPIGRACYPRDVTDQVGALSDLTMTLVREHSGILMWVESHTLRADNA